MHNKIRINRNIKELGLKLGICHDRIDTIPKSELVKIIKNIPTLKDTNIIIDGSKYIVEMDVFDDELDLKLSSRKKK